AAGRGGGAGPPPRQRPVAAPGGVAEALGLSLRARGGALPPDAYRPHRRRGRAHGSHGHPEAALLGLRRSPGAGARSLRLPSVGARPAIQRAGALQARRRTSGEHRSVASKLTKASAAASSAPSLTIVTSRGSATS